VAAGFFHAPIDLDSIMTNQHPGARLRALMKKGTVAAPGAFNALVGRAVAQAGFDACYVSGGATSVAAGVPDVGLLGLEYFARLIREVADASQLPVIADADTGFGEEEMVRRTVIEYHRAGAAGLHIEDQVFPKRCGHLDGKKLIPIEQSQSRVEWAAKASGDCSDGAFIICARTDAAGVEGFEAAIERARAYVQAGATMIFPEGLHSEDEFARFAEGLRADAPNALLLANMTEFGKTPMIPLDRFAAMGYNIVIYPVTMLRVAMGAVTQALAELKATGSPEVLLERMQTRQELYDLVGYTPGTPFEVHAKP
jgi:methylisocitrate lyase